MLLDDIDEKIDGDDESIFNMSSAKHTITHTNLYIFIIYFLFYVLHYSLSPDACGVISYRCWLTPCFVCQEDKYKYALVYAFIFCGSDDLYLIGRNTA